MKINFKLLAFIVLGGFLLLSAIFPVSAAPLYQDPIPVPAPAPSPFPVPAAIFLVAVIAWAKEQFNLSGNGTLIVGGVLALVVTFLPIFYDMIPAAQLYIKAFVDAVILFLTAVGGVSFFKYAVAKASTLWRGE